MADILELKEFFVEGKNQKYSHALLHISEPSTAEEYKKGYFFTLAEIKNGTIEQIEYIQSMIDDLETSYYSPDNNNEDNAFEVALEYVNRRGHHALENTNSELHCIVGAVNSGNIALAFHGQPESLVFYQTKNGLGVLPIIDQTENQDNPQLFSALLQGTIHPGDFFYIANPSVSKYFATDRVQKIISSRPLPLAIEHMQKVLTDLRSEESFAGILFHLLPPAEAPKTGKIPAYAKRGSADSLRQLMHAEQSTKNTLHPPLLGQTAQKLKSLWKNEDQEAVAPRQYRELTNINLPAGGEKKSHPETNYRPRHNDQPKLNSTFERVLIIAGKAIVFLAQTIFFVVQKIVITLKNILVGLIIIIFNHGHQREKIISDLRYFFKQKKDNFRSLPLINKIIFFAVIIFSLIFITSLVLIKMKTTRETQVKAYAEQIKMILEKKDAAEAGLIYNDDNRAFTLINEAKNLITNLPHSSKVEKTKIQELTAEIETTLTKLRKIILIKPTIVADLTQAHAGATPTELGAIDDQLIAYGPNDNYLYITKLTNNETTAKQLGAIQNLKATATPKENDFVLFISAANTLAALDKNSFTLNAKDISFPADAANITDLFMYNRRVYTLDNKNSQLWRHGPTQTGYERGTPWIKSAGIDLSDAVSFAIDGDVFILKQNGQVLKFTDGQIQDFNLTGIDPALTFPTHLWTYNGWNNIYILEPTNQRVVVIDKTGKLIQQYTASEWKNPTGILVNEKERKIYVLDEGKIYEFGI